MKRGEEKSFGGDWTEKKLEIVEDYLKAWLNVLKKQNWCHKKVYIDAFAGSGGHLDHDEEAFIIGSAQRALGLDGFDEYLFIEKKPNKVKKLRELVDKSERSEKVRVIKGDVNEELVAYLKKQDWSKTRAVLFLDPWACELKWESIKALRHYEGIDFLYLFPMRALNSMLPRGPEKKEPNEAKIRRLLGCGPEQFYKESPQESFFTALNMEGQKLEKVTQEAINKKVAKCLGEPFGGFVDYGMLKNSRNAPVFLLILVCTNPSKEARKIAKKIAKSLFKKWSEN